MFYSGKKIFVAARNQISRPRRSNSRPEGHHERSLVGRLLFRRPRPDRDKAGGTKEERTEKGASRDTRVAGNNWRIFMQREKRDISTFIPPAVKRDTRTCRIASASLSFRRTPPLTPSPSSGSFHFIPFREYISRMHMYPLSFSPAPDRRVRSMDPAPSLLRRVSDTSGISSGRRVKGGRTTREI